MVDDKKNAPSCVKPSLDHPSQSTPKYSCGKACAAPLAFAELHFMDRILKVSGDAAGRRPQTLLAICKEPDTRLGFEIDYGSGQSQS